MTRNEKADREIRRARGRRRWPQRALLAVGVAATLALGACGSPPPTDSSKPVVTLWYGQGGLDDTVVAAAAEHFPNIELKALKTPDVSAKFRTALAAGDAPDISTVGGNISDYFAAENKLADLKQLGVDDIRDQYVAWKWQQATSPTGKVLGFPIDTGPYAFYYRADLVQQAGLPADPAEMAKRLTTMDDYATASEQMRTASGGKTVLCSDASVVLMGAMAQQGKRFVDAQGQYIADQPYARKAWDRATSLARSGACIKPANSTELNSKLARGEIAGFLGYVWDKDTPKTAAPDQAGKWRIAPPPGGAAAETGSYMVISQSSKHQKEAYEVVKWLQSPENQAKAYINAGLFPSALAAYTDPAAAGPDQFYGGQSTMDVFASVAKSATIPPRAANDNQIAVAFDNGLTEVATTGADPNAVWNDIQDKAHKASGK